MGAMAQLLELPLDAAPPAAPAPRAILDAPDATLHDWLTARRQPSLRTRALWRGVQTAEQVLLDESRAEASGLQRLGRARDETPRGGAGGGAQRGR